MFLSQIEKKNGGYNYKKNIYKKKMNQRVFIIYIGKLLFCANLLDFFLKTLIKLNKSYININEMKNYFLR